MTSTMRSSKVRDLHRWINLFEIRNQADLTIAYRLLEVKGLPPGEHYDKNMNRLVKAVTYGIRASVVLLQQGGAHYLAIPADAPLPQLEQRLMPHVATLVPREETYSLPLDRLNEKTAPIAAAFLQRALGAPLWRDQGLWGNGRRYYSKQPVNARHGDATVDIYPGFVWNVIVAEDGRLFLAVDTVVRYVERCWLSERLNGGDPATYLRRYCLYHFGPQWYMVQLWGLTGLPVAEQRFLPNGKDQIVDVLTYTRECWTMNPPAWVRELHPESPAILYRYPGSEQERYGALALCKLALSTADAEARGLHRRSIVDPAPRFERIRKVVARHFQHAQLGGCRIQVMTTPLEIERRIFPIPPQRFGHDRVLAVEPNVPTDATDIVSLEKFGQRRLRLVLDPTAGPLDARPFDAQCLFLPHSLARGINEDFEQEFIRAVREVSGQQSYKVQRIIYDDRAATSLYKQVQAIKRAITDNRISRGYALLVLPERAKRDLHNYLKKALWPHLQFQCAMASKIRRYYEPTQDEHGFQLAPDQTGKFISYVRNCAFGMMVVNRKWSWALAAPLRYEVYIGIDVLNGVAGVTFVYNRGEQIFFRDFPCKHKERLTTAELRKILVTHLHQDLKALKLRPQSIVIHRDGRTFSSELKAVELAGHDLRGVLGDSVVVGIVDIRKTTADHLRLADGESLETAQNPTIGAPYRVNAREGVICTTGWPFRFPGTAKPLAAVIVEGPLDIDWVLEDILALSQPVFTAPDKCARLPLTIKLADDFLEPIAADADEEAARYEEEEEDGVAEIEGSDFVVEALDSASSLVSTA